MNVTTKQGWFWRTTTNKTIVGLDSEYFSSTERLPGNRLNWQSPTGIVNEATPYLIVNFQASNRRTTITREFPLIYWIFTNVGGIVEISSMIFLVCILMHREVVLEQKLLNMGILENDVNVNINTFARMSSGEN